ncbi:MAG: leucine-rich repeat domain-containing protein [Rhizobacter sp.]|nr:leucine-rich repeat domain-containing protein [Chlorobiales bacterium]
MDVDSSNIASLAGIEVFTGLQSLECSNNQLTSLDVSANTLLNSLSCRFNQLTSLDVSANTALSFLSCFDNRLTSLNISTNAALTILDCSVNQLTSLNFSANTTLQYLYCYNNQFVSLDVSANAALQTLVCSNNPLTSLDVSENIALRSLFCYNNQLTNLDISANTALETFVCSTNGVTSLDISRNTNLTNIDISNNSSLASMTVWMLPFPPSGVTLDASNTAAVFVLPGWVQNTVAPAITFNAVAAASASTFLTAGDSGKIYASVDSGKTWTASPQSISTANLKGLIVSDNFAPTLASKGNDAQSTQGFGSAVAVGVGGTILRSSDGGANWTSVNASGNNNALNAIDGTSGAGAKGNSTLGTQGFGSAVAVGVGGTILRSADGVSWTSAGSAGADLRGVAVSNDYTLAVVQKSNGAQGVNGFGSAVAVGVGGTILRSSDGGDNWNAPVSAPSASDLNAVAWFGDAFAAKGNTALGTQGFGSAVAVGVGGTILRSLDGGANWSSVSSGTNANLLSVVMTTQTVGYISGAGGTILKTTTGGAGWELQSSGTSDTLNAIAILPSGSGVAVGSNGTSVITNNGGGNTILATGNDAAPVSGKPSEFGLKQNYPNPFNPSTTISYFIPQPSSVRLMIYDVLGREVATLVNERQTAGNHSVSFNASELSSGIYFYRLAAGSNVQTKKMLFVK